MNQLYRCIITLTDERWKHIPPANFFYRAETAKQAEDASVSFYRRRLLKENLFLINDLVRLPPCPSLAFRINSYRSSDLELDNYAKSMHAGIETNRSVN